MVDGHANPHLLSARLRIPVHEHLATSLLIDLTIGNNRTADSATAIISKKYSAQAIYIALKSDHNHHCTDETQKVETVALSAVVLLPII